MAYETGGVPAATGGGKPTDLASFGERLGALLIDALVLGAGFLIVMVMSALSDALGILVGIAWFVAALGYSVYLEGSPSGQTVGKKVLNIRVVDSRTAGSIDYSRAFIRWLVRSVASGALCGLGYLWMLWDADKQTWHDKIANTQVVRTATYPVDKWPG